MFLLTRKVNIKHMIMNCFNSSHHFIRVPEGIYTCILGDKVQEMDPELGRLLKHPETKM